MTAIKGKAIPVAGYQMNFCIFNNMLIEQMYQIFKNSIKYKETKWCGQYEVKQVYRRRATVAGEDQSQKDRLTRKLK